MIEQLLFVACLTLYMYLTSGNIWRPSICLQKEWTSHVENVIMMF